jgi:hypothetical protein
MKSGILTGFAVLFLGAAWAAAQAPAVPDPGSLTLVAAPAKAPAAVVNAASLTSPVPPGNPAVLGPATAPGMNGFAPSVTAANGPGCLPDDAGCPAGPGPGFCYVDLEYLLWHIKSDRLPILTTASAAGLSIPITTNQPGPNALTRMTNLAPVFLTDSTSFNNLPNPGEHSGFRFTVGYWADSDRTFGVDASFWDLERRGSALTVITTRGNNQFPVSTPFTNFILGPIVQVASGNGGVAPQLTFVPQPVIFTGAVNAVTRVSESNWLLGGDINARCTFVQYGCVQVGGLVGFRSFAFNETLSINNLATLGLTPQFPLPVADPASMASTLAPTVVQVQTTDGVRAHNTFWGGQIGAEIDSYCGRLFFTAQEKIGVGVMHQSVSVDGNTAMSVNIPGGAPILTNSPGGLLVGPGDVGNHSRSRVAFFSDTSLKLGYILTDWFRFHVGYDVMTMTNVVRAGSVAGLSTSTVTATVAGTGTTVTLSQPSFQFKDSTMWIHGLNLGLEFLF